MPGNDIAKKVADVAGVVATKGVGDGTKAHKDHLNEISRVTHQTGDSTGRNDKSVAKPFDDKAADASAPIPQIGKNKRPVPDEFDHDAPTPAPKRQKIKFYNDSHPDVRPDRPGHDKWNDKQATSDGSAISPKPGNSKDRDSDGTYQDRENEKARLSDKYGKEVNGKTHESEHVFPFHASSHNTKDPSGNKSKSRANTPARRDIENQSWAYHEMKAAHRAHAGTNKWDMYGAEKRDGDREAVARPGDLRKPPKHDNPDGNSIAPDPATPKGSGANPAWTSSQNYNRDQLHTATSSVDGGIDNTADILKQNQLGYAHVTHPDSGLPYHRHIALHGTPAEKTELQQSNDSFEHMVHKMHESGQGHIYGNPQHDGADGASHSQGLDAVGASEAIATRRMVQHGGYDLSIVNQARAEFGLPPMR